MQSLILLHTVVPLEVIKGKLSMVRRTPPKRRTFRFYGFPSGKNFLFFLTYGPRNLVREKLGKNERKAALHRSVYYNISIVLSSSPSSCDSTGISTVQIFALVVDLMHY